MTAELAALLATGLALVGALPQLRRLCRTGDPRGVSLANATLGVASELGWLAYAAQESLWSVLPEAVLMTVTNALLIRALLRTGVPFVRPLAVTAVWAAALVAGTAFGGAALLGAMLPIAYAVQVVPSIWAAYRTWEPSGVAAATWALILAESLLWGVYGLARRDPAVTMFGVIGSSSSTAVIVRLLTTRARVRESRLDALVAAR